MGQQLSFYQIRRDNGHIWKKRILGLVLASVSMIGWYFVAALLLGYGLGAAWAGILGNVLQNFFGMFVGYLVYLAYLRFEKH